jgi:hypothetical protein
MLSSRHSWQPRLAHRPGSSQRLNRVALADIQMITGVSIDLERPFNG